jgi:hypothetical protein
MPKSFLTYFDINYAAYGLAMLESLLQWGDPIRITVLCLDDDVAKVIVSEFGNRVRIVSMEELATHEPALRRVKDSREPWEFYATHKPILIDWALRQTEPGSLIAFTDADTFYYSDPSPLFDEASSASIALSPHRFNAGTQHLAIYGLYNAGFGLWRNNASGRKCLQDWAHDCLEWCHARVDEKGRFMNQGYLNQWPTRYEGVHILTHPGANLAPWNVATHTLTKTAAGVLVDAQPLIFYHFSSLFRKPAGGWRSYDQGEGMKQQTLHQSIYAPYLKAVEDMSRRLIARYGVTGIGSVRATGGNTPMVHFTSRQSSLTTPFYQFEGTF